MGGIDIGKLDTNVYIAYSRSLEKRNSAAAKFLSRVKHDPATINSWMLTISRGGEDPTDVAEACIEENMDAVSLD